ncbi:hypothetical protein [Caulobacter sp. NIBR2454]|uniref:hypothetical protein n=1 Tax=Caulobacter sp. NIBR2454 TaxID=3015996 RepID=UPI0022B5F586|nr:hypothetical protein [Caulobacter sp. NIBR2454]
MAAFSSSASSRWIDAMLRAIRPMSVSIRRCSVASFGSNSVSICADTTALAASRSDQPAITAAAPPGSLLMPQRYETTGRR